MDNYKLDTITEIDIDKILDDSLFLYKYNSKFYIK